MDGTCVILYQELQKALRKNKIFLTVSDNHLNGKLIVCECKHRTKWRSLLNDDDPTSPIGVFNSLEEAKAFAVGITIGQNKAWKY